MWNVYEFVMKLDSVLYGLYPSRNSFLATKNTASKNEAVFSLHLIMY